MLILIGRAHFQSEAVDSSVYADQEKAISAIHSFVIVAYLVVILSNDKIIIIYKAKTMRTLVWTADGYGIAVAEAKKSLCSGKSTQIGKSANILQRSGYKLPVFENGLISQNRRIFNANPIYAAKAMG